jgi:hypothetical protein
MTAMDWRIAGLDALVEQGRRFIARGVRNALARRGVALDLDALPERVLFDPLVHAYLYWPDAPMPFRVPADLGGGVELARGPDPAWMRVLAPEEPGTDLAIGECARRHGAALVRALDLLRALDPGYAEELARDLRLVVLFRSRVRGSCANFSAYGAVFLQCEPDASMPFFCEDLAHQAAHVTFYAVTADPRRAFRVPPAVTIARLGGPAHDTRSLFDALHGNFTLARMIQVLDGLLHGVELDADERAETAGRLALALERLDRGLDSVDDERLFTPEVWRIHEALRVLSDAMRQRHAGLVASADLRGQPYVFSWPIYRRRNGEPSASAGY